MNKVCTRFYYTLNELQNPSAAVEGFSTLINYWLGSSSYTDGTYDSELYGDIADKYGDNFVYYIDVYHYSYVPVERPSVSDIRENDEVMADVQRFIKKLRNWLNDSHYRYDILVKLYDDRIADANKVWTKQLMNQIENTVQFNDTPQTSASGLDADTYATTYTKSKSDPGTVIQRMNDIRNLLSSVYEEWTGEFGKKFILLNY